MPSSGPNNPGTMANDSSVGSFSWSNVDNAKTSNNAYATVSLSVFNQSHYLKATNFGFSIPDVRILGITVSIERNANFTGPGIKDTIVRLVKGGTVVGDNKANASEWPTSDAVQSYGGIADLWGTTWTAADLNASDFGIVLSCESNGGMFSKTASVDHVTITIEYALEISVFDTITVTDVPFLSSNQLLLERQELLVVSESQTLAFNPLLLAVNDAITTAEFTDFHVNVHNIFVTDEIVAAEATNFAFNPLLVSVFDSLIVDEISSVVPRLPASILVSRPQVVPAHRFRKPVARFGIFHTGFHLPEEGDAGLLLPLQTPRPRHYPYHVRRARLTQSELFHTGESFVAPDFTIVDRVGLHVFPAKKQSPHGRRQGRIHSPAQGFMLPVFHTGSVGDFPIAEGDHAILRGVRRGLLRGIG